MVIVITGVSTGIGQTLTDRFLSEGHKVYGSVRKIKDVDRWEGHRSFIPLIMDVTSDEEVKAAAEKVRQQEADGIDVLINNAGIAVGGPLTEIKLEKVDYQFQVNVMGVLRTTQAFYPLLRGNDEKKPGRIIQISSVSGKIGMPFIGPYSASKHALEGLSHSLRRELLDDGIDVIIVGPGAVKTPIWDKSIQPIEEDFTDSRYAKVIQRFQKVFVSSAIKTGLSAEWLVDKIYHITLSKNPKTRYSFVAKRLTNWIAPRFLPDRLIDKVIRKQIFSK